jgi:ribose transport system substrate-binding protein
MQSSRNGPGPIAALLAVAVALVVALGACGSGDSGGGGDAGGGKGAVAMSFGDLSVALWKDEIDDMKPLLEERGYTFLSDDPKGNVQTQVNDWEGWIARGDVKAIMGYPLQVNALVPVTKKAQEAGIEVLGYSQNWPGTTAALVTDPAKDGEVLGRSAGTWLTEKFGDEPTRVAVLGGRATDLLRFRTDGIVAGVKATNPNAEIDVLSTDLSRTEGFNQAKSELERRGKVDAWIGISDDPMAGAYKAVTAAGVAPDDPNVFFGTLDLTEGTLELMGKPNSIWRVGYVFTRDDLVKINVDMLTAAAEGRPVEDVRVDPTLVTPENYKQFEGQV